MKGLWVLKMTLVAMELQPLRVNSEEPSGYDGRPIPSR